MQSGLSLGGNGEIPIRADSELSGLGKQAEVTK